MTSKALEKKQDAALEKVEKLPTYTPRVDIIESEEALELTMDMPGVDEKGVEIQLEGQDLQITGTFDHPVDTSLSNSYREYRACNYQRKFTLGNTIDRNGIQAKMKDGVLELYLPKVEEAQPRKIKVVSG